MNANFTREFVAHPVLTGVLLQPSLPLLVRAGLPVPPFSEIPVGFDAIFQFRSDFLGRHFFTEYCSYTDISISLDYRREDLSAQAREAIADLVTETKELILEEEGVEESGRDLRRLPGCVRRDNLELEPVGFQVAIARPDFELKTGSPAVAQLRWPVLVKVTVRETAEGYAERYREWEYSVPRHLRGTGVVPPPEIEPRSRLLTQGTALISSAFVELDTDVSRFQVRARLDFSGSEVTLQSRNELFRDLLESGLTEAVDELLNPLLTGPGMATTPWMSIVGDMRPLESYPGWTYFQVRHVATLGNDPDHQVLSICVDVSGTGSLDRVRPFVGDKNFAYYVSEDIVRVVMRTRWTRTDTPKVLETEIPVEMAVSEDSEETCYGRGRVLFTFQGVPDVALIANDGQPDTLRLTGSYEIRLLELWDCSGERVGRLDDLGKPEVKPFALHLFLFEDVPDTEEGEGKRFLKRLAGRLLPPIYRPIAAGSRISHRSVRGRASAALGAVFLRGNLG